MSINFTPNGLFFQTAYHSFENALVRQALTYCCAHEILKKAECEIRWAGGAFDYFF
jgi:hypothetical protein